MQSLFSFAITLFLLISCMAHVASGKDAEKDLKLPGAKSPGPLEKLTAIKAPKSTRKPTGKPIMKTAKPSFKPTARPTATPSKKPVAAPVVAPTVMKPTSDFCRLNPYSPYCLVMTGISFF